MLGARGSGSEHDNGADLFTLCVCVFVCAQDNLTQEVSTLKADNGELRAKLEESKQQLQSNEQMIRWLNQQVRCGGWI